MEAEASWKAVQPRDKGGSHLELDFGRGSRRAGEVSVTRGLRRRSQTRDVEIVMRRIKIKDVMYSIGNTVNNTVITLYAGIW